MRLARAASEGTAGHFDRRLSAVGTCTQERRFPRGALFPDSRTFLFAGGAKGSRLALPHSRIMIHQPMGGAQGQAEDIKVEAAQILRIKENLVRLYSQMTGQTQERILMDLDRDNFMSAQEAFEYGLVDTVIEVAK